MNSITMQFILATIAQDLKQDEIAQITEALKSKEGPPLNPKEVIDRLEARCKEMWNGSNKLSIVKHVKDTTGWGLKESKDWADLILPYKPFPNE